MQIEIGNKKLSELTAENLLQIVLIEGCCPGLEFWNEPIILEFNNTMFRDTFTIDFHSFRKEDNLKSCEYTFFLNFEDYYFHYTRDYEKERLLNSNYTPIDRNTRLGIKSIRYLIHEGFEIPLH